MGTEWVACRRLYIYDFGTEISQHRSRQSAWHPPAKVQYD
jgi:hypothetical protein